MKKLLQYFFFLLLVQQVFAQADNQYVPGELIVQLRKNSMSSTENIFTLCQSFQNINLAAKKILSHRLQIWLITYENSMYEDHQVLSLIKTHPLVVQAQFNHYVTIRETFPDDPLFTDQWALLNTGQFGGVPGADIDATKAWIITTGGLTVLGDTIVLGIVDLGFDLEHVDLNFWKNYEEIPDNGIDDDENGYIDDYDGWNTVAGNGQLPPHNHGTHVAGIAGAKGNNSIGVSGVNWNVLIMPIVSPTSTESGVVEAYGYILEMRARYNETNGEEGAFVVATNASFGVDLADPDDYPIWGAMYDSLGIQGILSVGATANANWNIDVVGDVPTAFPSDYLITVTNTTNMDVKYTNAGYGSSTIDLGAPGYMIMSTIINSQYDYKSGTSMSAPCITGAIGLLLAAADTATLQSYRDNPSEMALIFKDHILNSVDKLPSLEGITVSEGRLNVYKMLLLLLGEPILQQDPVTITFTAGPDAQDTTDLLLTNFGGSTAHYVATVDPLANWISLEYSSDSVAAGSTGALQINFETTGLTFGHHYADLYISYENDLQLHVPVDLFVTPFIAIEEPSQDNDMTVFVYPNPSNSKASIALSLTKEAIVSVDILDSFGRCIWKFSEHFLSPGEHILVWEGNSSDLHPVAPGLYFCHIQTGERTIIRKIVRY